MPSYLRVLPKPTDTKHDFACFSRNERDASAYEPRVAAPRRPDQAAPSSGAVAPPRVSRNRRAFLML